MPTEEVAGHACGPHARGRRRKRPRILDTLDRARKFRTLLEAGEVKTAAEIAKRYGVTRARVTQIMNLLKLAPEVLARIEALEGTEGTYFLSERRVRELVQLRDPAEQFRRIDALLGQN